MRCGRRGAIYSPHPPVAAGEACGQRAMQRKSEPPAEPLQPLLLPYFDKTLSTCSAAGPSLPVTSSPLCAWLVPYCLLKHKLEYDTSCACNYCLVTGVPGARASADKLHNLPHERRALSLTPAPASRPAQIKLSILKSPRGVKHI